MLTYGSLASGVGGLDRAVEAVFHTRQIWHSEIDKQAIKIHETHWEDVPNIGDIKTVDWTSIGRPDIICGGYPCQPFSTAGPRKGFDDPRNLWPYFADAIRILRPRLVILENVSAHLSSGFDRVLGDLAKMGYDAEWGVFKAADAGAPHRRARLFIVAYPHSEGELQPQGIVGEIRRWIDYGREESATDPGSTTGREKRGKASGSETENGEDASNRLESGHVVASDSGSEGCEGGGGTELRLDGDGLTNWGKYTPAVDRWTRITRQAPPKPMEGKRLNP